MSFFPIIKKLIFILSGELFCVWNSPIIQPFLNWFHDNHILEGRTIDYSDNFALISLILAYRYLDVKNKRILRLKPLLISLMSMFVFVATTVPPREMVTFAINRQYDFNYTVEDLCNRLNLIANDYVNKYNKAMAIDSIGNAIILKYSNDTSIKKSTWIDFSLLSLLKGTLG